MNNMKLRTSKFYTLLAILIAVASVSCKKSSNTPPAGITSATFYHGFIIGNPYSVGPGNAVLLRNDLTMREYANDYYSAGTSMGASDTATAKIKIDGTYYFAVTGSVKSIVATWKSTSGTALTYTLTGTVMGSTITGTFASAGTGIGSTANFSFTTP